MVFLTAVRSDVDAAVAYHGGDTEKYLSEVNGLHAPLLMHLAEEDESFPSLHKLRSKRHFSRSRTQWFTAIRVNITHSLGTAAHTTMPGSNARPWADIRISTSKIGVTVDAATGPKAG